MAHTTSPQEALVREKRETSETTVASAIIEDAKAHAEAYLKDSEVTEGGE